MQLLKDFTHHSHNLLISLEERLNEKRVLFSQHCEKVTLINTLLVKSTWKNVLQKRLLIRGQVKKRDNLTQ